MANPDPESKPRIAVFAGATPVKTLAAHLYETPAPLKNHRNDVPPELEAIILRCLAKNPADRFPDVRSLAAALESCGTSTRWTEAWRRLTLELGMEMTHSSCRPMSTMVSARSYC